MSRLTVPQAQCYNENIRFTMQYQAPTYFPPLRSRRPTARSPFALPAYFAPATRTGLWLCLLLLLAVPGFAQDAPDALAPAAPSGEPELCRWRVENVAYGRVEISTDGGNRYLLVGRVTHPATGLLADDSASTLGTVTRARLDSVTFAVAPRRSLNLRLFAPPSAPAPIQTSAKRKPPRLPAWNAPAFRTCDLVIGLMPLSGDLRVLLPPARSAVSRQTGPTTLQPFYNDYLPADTDAFVFSVPPVSADPAAPSDYAAQQNAARFAAQTLARRYSETAVARARQEKRLVVSGTLTLNARLPVTDPDAHIVYVSYALDNDVVAARNTPPFRAELDTRRVADGEHVVEIRGLNDNGRLVSRVRSLIVVQNEK